MNRVFYSNELNLEIANAAAKCKTAQEILSCGKEISKKHGKKVGSIVTKIYLIRRKAGISSPRKQRSDANPYTPIVNNVAKIETKKEKNIEKNIEMNLNFIPSRVEVCNDHIKLYF
jgi:hypothetical protein